MKKYIILLNIVPCLILAQPSPTQQRMKDFGFITKQVIPFTTNVNTTFDIVFEPTEIFYVNSINQICYFKNISGTWTNVGVLNSGAPAIRTGGQIQHNGNKIFYVGSSDSKIYQLENTSGTTWISTLLVSGQTTVRNDADILYSFPHVYYIGSNNRVCDIVLSGSTWTGGNALVATSWLVRANSKLIQPINTSLIYYIASNNGICELAYSSGWSGGSTTIGGATVLPGTNLETNGYAFYYVSNLNNKVWALYWSGGWQILNLVPSSENVRTDVALKYHDNTIYYVGASSGKLNILSLNGSGVWSGVPVNTSSSVVKINSKLLAYANPIFEEGSNWATFNSANLFYVDNLNTLHYFVFDDSPCTSGWHYHDMVWNTEACKVGGSFPKEWHYGPDPNIELAKTVNPNIRIGQFNKDIYFVDATNKIQILNRTPPINSITFNTNWVLTFSDEFNSLSTTQTKWNPQYPHANNHHFTTKAFNNNYNNLSYNSGIMSIETHEEPSVNTFQGWGKGFFWNDSCFIKHYDYSTTSLQTGCLNCNSNVSPVPQLVNCSGAPLVKEHTFAQKYGWFEIRSKTPRGKGMWNAFWMVPRDMGYTWTNEIDIFEIPGNGKYIAQTNWTDFLPGGGRDNEAKIIDCIGYRAFDDYHTYAVKWTDHDLIFYYDNKPVGSAFTYYIPTASEMFLILSNYTNDQSGSEMMIQSEVQNFPNYWGVDYVRVYAPYIMPKTSLQTESNLNFKVYPVPTKDEITIETPESSFYSLQIYSAEGKLVRELSNLTGTVNLDIKDLLPGIYLFKFQSVEEVSFRKVTVI